MTYLIARRPLASILTDDPIIAPGDFALLASAADALSEIGAIQAEARAAAQRAGFADGQREGLDSAGFRLLDLHREADDRHAQLLAAIGSLAIEVLRQVAGDLAESSLVAGLITKAVAQRVDRARLRIRVSPQAALAEGELAALTALGIDIVADPELGPHACIIESDFDVTNAGFDVQIAAIERAWANRSSVAEAAVDA